MTYIFKVIQLLLADVFKNFRNRCIDTYELNPTQFSSAPGLAWKACFKKKKKRKIRVITWQWYANDGWKRG